MAEQYVPGLQFQDWTKSPSLTGDLLGGIIRGAIGVPLAAAAQKIKDAISPPEQEKDGQSGLSQSPTAVPPPMQFEPNTNFPELFSQQYISPYSPGYLPPGVRPPSLQGIVTPGMMNPNQMMSGQFFRQPLQQAQPTINDQVSQIWGPNPLGGR